MITPFTKNGNVDKSAARRIAEHLVESGAAPFVLGTTGELASIPLKQRKSLVKAVAKQTDKRINVYAGISGCAFSESIELAKEYFDYGVDAFVAHVPYYYPLKAELMQSYFATLADQIPAPLLIYNIPITTHMSIPLESVEILSHHPNIVGLKDSERDEDRLHKSAKKWKHRTDFSLFCGWGAQMATALKEGFDGIVPSTGNIIPEKYKAMYDAVLKKNMMQALQLQNETDTISKVYQKDRILSQSLPALKVIMNSIGLCDPYVLSPLLMLDKAEADSIIHNYNEHVEAFLEV